MSIGYALDNQSVLVRAGGGGEARMTQGRVLGTIGPPPLQVATVLVHSQTESDHLTDL